MSGWNHKLEGLQLNPEESLHSLEFATSQEAWEKLNEGFLRLEPALFAKGAIANSGVAVVYNVFIKIRKIRKQHGNGLSFYQVKRQINFLLKWELQFQPMKELLIFG